MGLISPDIAPGCGGLLRSSNDGASWSESRFRNRHRQSSMRSEYRLSQPICLILHSKYVEVILLPVPYSGPVKAIGRINKGEVFCTTQRWAGLRAPIQCIIRTSLHMFRLNAWSMSTSTGCLVQNGIFIRPGNSCRIWRLETWSGPRITVATGSQHAAVTSRVSTPTTRISPQTSPSFRENGVSNSRSCQRHSTHRHICRSGAS